MKEAIITVPDMQSSHCQSRVSNAVKQVEGVTIRTVEPGQLTVSLESDTLTRNIEKAIRKAGYTIGAGDSQDEK